MPTFFTSLTRRADTDEPLHPGQQEGTTWRPYVLEWGGVRVEFSEQGTSHGGPGMSYAAVVDEQAAEVLRYSPDAMRGHVWEKQKSPAEQRAERRESEETAATRTRAGEDAALEGRVRSWVRDEMARAGVIPADDAVRPGTVQSAMSGGMPPFVRARALGR